MDASPHVAVAEPWSRPPSTPPSTTRDGYSTREDEATLRHQLRMCRAELANCQAKLGIKPNNAPFGSSTARRTSLGPLDAATPPFPSRKTSTGDLRSSITLSSSPEGRPSMSNGNGSPRTANGLPSPGSVALARALVAEEGRTNGEDSHTHSRTPVTSASPASASTSPLLETPAHMNGSRRTSAGGGGDNPFFGGSGAARDRLNKSTASSQSGSGKVISTLQSDLLQARSALDSMRGQLRVSQRAVEHLGRVSEDLKDGKERDRAEIEGLTRTLARRERMQEEALGRARVAEAALAELQLAHKALMASSKSRIKELEEGKKRADEARAKADAEYAALSRGMKAMSDGWKDDLRWLKSDMTKTEARCTTSAAAVNKLTDTRTSLHKDVKLALHGLADQQQAFAVSCSTSISSALSELETLKTRHASEETRVETLNSELRRIRRLMVEHHEAEAEAEGATVAA